MMGDPKHFSKEKTEKVGIFEKSKNYRTVCKGCGHGYHNGMWQAHHVLPGVTLQRSAIANQVKNAEKEEYIENCKWITKWDVNATPNMMGLPTIWDYILAEKIKKASGSDKEVIEVSKYRAARIIALIKKLAANFVAPENLPAHNPVSWGHTDFNKEVADYLKKNIWNTIDEKKEEHKVNPEDIQGALEDGSDYFIDELKDRGARGDGTETEWSRRFDAGNTTWYHPFSMALDPKNPL